MAWELFNEHSLDAVESLDLASNGDVRFEAFGVERLRVLRQALDLLPTDKICWHQTRTQIALGRCEHGAFGCMLVMKDGADAMAVHPPCVCGNQLNREEVQFVIGMAIDLFVSTLSLPAPSARVLDFDEAAL
jgi:hypothetical protein